MRSRHLAILAALCAAVIVAYLNVRTKTSDVDLIERPKFYFRSDLEIIRPEDIVKVSIRGWPRNAWRTFGLNSTSVVAWDTRALAYDIGFGLGLILSGAYLGYLSPMLRAMIDAACKRIAKGAQPDGRQCLVCSYSLRGDISGRCPECGTKVSG